LTRIGFTPIEAIQTATLNPAIFLGRHRRFGSVAVAKIADLVLLEADPSVKISSTRRIAAVIVNGRFFDKTELDRMRNQGR
jgi:imidazolonepropionase-like amidohydrolase